MADGTLRARQRAEMDQLEAELRAEACAAPADEDVRERVLAYWKECVRGMDGWSDDNGTITRFANLGIVRKTIALLSASGPDKKRRTQDRYPCGCVTCICEDDARCHGCGARSCGRPDAACDLRRPTLGADEDVRTELLQYAARLRALGNRIDRKQMRGQTYPATWMEAGTVALAAQVMERAAEAFPAKRK